MSTKIQRLLRQNFIILLVSMIVFLGIVFVMIYQWIYLPNNMIRPNISTLIPFAIKNDNVIKLAFLKINLPLTNTNPLNGIKYTKSDFESFTNKPILAVMIENHPDARPQTGLLQADIVYETLAEGGITRFMSIIYSQVSQVKKIGPIRSARNYYLELVKPYDALYMHIGCAYSKNLRVNACNNRFIYNIKTVDYYGSFYRVSHKYAPHNAYSTPNTIYQIAKKNKLYAKSNLVNISKSWEFKTDALPIERGSSSSKPVKVIFHTDILNDGWYDVEWHYNKLTNNYTRFMAGTKHFDEVSKNVITPKVVILQRTKMLYTNNSSNRVIFNVIGNGKAFILQDGKVIKAKWYKKDREHVTTYTNAKTNQPILFNKGQRWVQIIPLDEGKIAF